MKIKYKDCTDEQKKVIINAITTRLDRKSKDLNVFTKRKLCECVYRDFVTLYHYGVDIKLHHIKDIVKSLNDTNKYLIMSSGSPKGYVLIQGPNNPHADILKSIECIERNKSKQIKELESQVIEPAKHMERIGIPSATQTAIDAQRIIRQIANNQPLEEVLNILKGIEKTSYITKLIPVTIDSHNEERIGA